MKNLRTFEQFVNENAEALFEKKELSPANIKTYNANKNSAKALKNWSIKLKDYTVKFNDLEYYGTNSEFFEFINNVNNTKHIDHFSVRVNDVVISIPISRKNNKSEIKFDSVYLPHIHFDIKDLEYLQYIDENEDKILGFIDLLNYLFKKYENEIYDFVDEKLNLQTLYVIKAGEIAPATGKTGHGWSIYDNPDGILGICKGTRKALWTANEMKVGDKFKLLDDQTHKVVSNEVEIEALIPATYKDYVAYSRKRGLEVPVAPFKKQTGSGRLILYSIK